MEKVTINKSQVEKLISDGVSKKEIRDSLYPQLNDAQWKAALKKMGLSNKRVPKVDFIIEDETPVEVKPTETVVNSKPAEVSQYIPTTSVVGLPSEGSMVSLEEEGKF